ncbi:MAG: TraR/DksA family transcriptional regulator [Patescibacteria group bacterium]
MNTDKFKSKLKKQKKELRTMLERFAKEDEKPKGDWDTKFPEFDNRHIEEAADEVEEFDSLRSIEHSLELKLKRTNEALEKIKKGTYGKCEECGKNIGEDRLEVVPATKTCKDCN